MKIHILANKLLRFSENINRLIRKRLHINYDANENGDIIVNKQKVYNAVYDSPECRELVFKLFDLFYNENLDLIQYEKRKKWSEDKNEQRIV